MHDVRPPTGDQAPCLDDGLKSPAATGGNLMVEFGEAAQKLSTAGFVK